MSPFRIVVRMLSKVVLNEIFIFIYLSIYIASGRKFIGCFVAFTSYCVIALSVNSSTLSFLNPSSYIYNKDDDKKICSSNFQYDSKFCCFNRMILNNFFRDCFEVTWDWWMKFVKYKIHGATMNKSQI